MHLLSFRSVLLVSKKKKIDGRLAKNLLTYTFLAYQKEAESIYRISLSYHVIPLLWLNPSVFKRRISPYVYSSFYRILRNQQIDFLENEYLRSIYGSNREDQVRIPSLILSSKIFSRNLERVCNSFSQIWSKWSKYSSKDCQNKWLRC